MNLLTGISYRALVYDILQSFDTPCSVKNLIVIGEAIGFSTGVIRATLHDLQKENLIHSPRRSFYDINHDIFADQYEWIIKKHHFIDDWPDNFLAISYLSTPRHNQTLQKKRIEALTVFGFIEYEKNFLFDPII